MKKLFCYAIAAVFALVGCSDPNAHGGDNGATKYSVSLDSERVVLDASAAEWGTTVTCSGGEWHLAASGTPVSWCTPVSVSGTTGQSADFIIDENTDYDERNAVFTVSCGTASATIVIVQKPYDALLVGSNRVEVSAVGGEVLLNVQANVDFGVTVDAGWIAYEGTRALKSSTVVLFVEPNNGKAREGYVEIFSTDNTVKESVTLYQRGSSQGGNGGSGDGGNEGGDKEKGSIIVSETFFPMPAEGGSVSVQGKEMKVEVKYTADYDYSIDADWIVEVTSRAQSSHTHWFEVLPNESPDERMGNIIFTLKSDPSVSQSVLVLQQGRTAGGDEEREPDWRTDKLWHRALITAFTSDYGVDMYNTAVMLSSVKGYYDGTERSEFMVVATPFGDNNENKWYSEEMQPLIDFYTYGSYEMLWFADMRYAVLSYFDAERAWSEAKKDLAEYPAHIGVSFTSEIDGDNLSAEITLYPQQTGSCRVTAVVLEDGLTDGFSQFFTYDNVARFPLTGLPGDEFYLKAGEPLELDYEHIVPDGLNRDNLRLLVYVSVECGAEAFNFADFGYRVANSASGKVGTSVPLRFALNKTGGNEDIIQGEDIE